MTQNLLTKIICFSPRHLKNVGTIEFGRVRSSVCPPTLPTGHAARFFFVLRSSCSISQCVVLPCVLVV